MKKTANTASRAEAPCSALAFDPDGKPYKHNPKLAEAAKRESALLDVIKALLTPTVRAMKAAGITKLSVNGDFFVVQVSGLGVFDGEIAPEIAMVDAPAKCSHCQSHFHSPTTGKLLNRCCHCGGTLIHWPNDQTMQRRP